MTGSGRYHDGRTANVRTVTLKIDATNLVIVDGDGSVVGRWPLAALFRDVRQPAAIVIGCGSDGARLEIIEREFASHLRLKTTTWSRQDLLANKKWIYIWLGGVVLLVALAIFARRPIVQFVTRQISPETERKAALALMAQLDFKKCILTKEQSAALDKIVLRLVPDETQRFHLKVDLMKSSQVNAYTFPGGQIFLLSGLIRKAESPEELAGVLAHEIVHAQKRHVMQSVVESMLFVSLLNLAVGDASGILLIDPATASRLLSLKLGREMEREADHGAMQLLANAKVSHQGLLDFFEKQQKEHEGKHSYLNELNLISTHPLSSERIDHLKSTPIVETRPQLLGTQDWEALQSACASEL